MACAALRAIRGMDDAMGVVLCLDALAWAAAAGHEAVRAATLAAAAEAGLGGHPGHAGRPAPRASRRGAPGGPRGPARQRNTGRRSPKGSAMDPAEAIAFALGEPGPAPAGRRPGG